MKHIVVDGDCIASIAAAYGFADAKTILDHPNNAALKQVRPDGNALHPGDEVFIPERKPKTLSLATGKRHKIVVKRPTRLLRIKFLDPAGQPMSGAFTLKAGTTVYKGNLDGDGILEQELPVTVVAAEVTIGHQTRTGRTDVRDGSSRERREQRFVSRECLAVLVGKSVHLPKYAIGDCVIPDDAPVERTVRMVAVSDQGYRTFSHVLADGKLVLAEDYGKATRQELERGHAKIECPRTEGTFSPDRYISEIGMGPAWVQHSLTNRRGMA